MPTGINKAKPMTPWVVREMSVLPLLNPQGKVAGLGGQAEVLSQGPQEKG